MAHINVEIKARCRNLDRVRSLLLEEGAEHRGTDIQKDTYFRVNEGRLKLREGTVENNLIHYLRPESREAKVSDVALCATESGSALREVLSRACGVLVVVEKEREILLLGNVKFHLDRVEKLGTFLEIEAIDLDGSHTRESLLAQCLQYQELLGVDDADLVGRSYSDSLLEG